MMPIRFPAAEPTLLQFPRRQPLPPTIQWYVRTALVYLLVSSALGVAYQIELWRPVFGLTS